MGCCLTRMVDPDGPSALLSQRKRQRGIRPRTKCKLITTKTLKTKKKANISSTKIQHQIRAQLSRRYLENANTYRHRSTSGRKRKRRRILNHHSNQRLEESS